MGELQGKQLLLAAGAPSQCTHILHGQVQVAQVVDVIRIPVPRDVQGVSLQAGECRWYQHVTTSEAVAAIMSNLRTNNKHVLGIEKFLTVCHTVNLVQKAQVPRVSL